MRFHRYAPLLIVAAMALIGACGKKEKPEEAMREEDSAAAIPTVVTITKAEPGPEYPHASLKVLAPGPNQVVTDDSVLVKVQLDSVDLGAPTAGEQGKGLAFSKDGQHIHVIIDDKPYMAMYRVDSFSVGALTEGAHTLRAFPSRSWHESIKVPGAFVAHTFYYKKKTGTPALKPGAPLLTYSRPKGEYKGDDARRILLDFFLSNAELAPDKYKVIVSIDGQVKDTLTAWVPYIIEGLTDGDHSIKLQLVDPAGAVVPGDFNTVERTIKVSHGAAAAAPMDHGSMSSGPDSGTAGANTPSK